MPAPERPPEDPEALPPRRAGRICRIENTSSPSTSTPSVIRERGKLGQSLLGWPSVLAGSSPPSTFPNGSPSSGHPLAPSPPPPARPPTAPAAPLGALRDPASPPAAPQPTPPRRLPRTAAVGLQRSQNADSTDLSSRSAESGEFVRPHWSQGPSPGSSLSASAAPSAREGTTAAAPAQQQPLGVSASEPPSPPSSPAPSCPPQSNPPQRPRRYIAPVARSCSDARPLLQTSSIPTPPGVPSSCPGPDEVAARRPLVVRADRQQNDQWPALPPTADTRVPHPPAIQGPLRPRRTPADKPETSSGQVHRAQARALIVHARNTASPATFQLPSSVVHPAPPPLWVPLFMVGPPSPVPDLHNQQPSAVLCDGATDSDWAPLSPPDSPDNLGSSPEVSD
eukprot:TRINITY_DN16109_c0_g1_i1.p1 TRINITY_DN16109_c0_g1~~TRINITY_DN16109_c0_g1_i1.p1  ORF type:complete len:426 (+),score=15.22 TRINITY_DN16109_c0_g1_i1:95-1279(+)